MNIALRRLVKRIVQAGNKMYLQTQEAIADCVHISDLL